MKKLSDIIKPEHRFYTVDGTMLNTAQDLFRYISECTPENFSAHVNDKKNDFANWTRDVLKLPILASKLQTARTIETASDVLLDHFKTVDKYIESIDRKKYFITIDEYDLKDVLDLYYYVANCSDASYNHHISHVVDGRNDFVKWTDEVLNLKDLSTKLSSCKTRDEVVGLLSKFLVDEHPLDYNLEISNNNLSSGITNTTSQVNTKFFPGTKVPDITPKDISSSDSNFNNSKPENTSPNIPYTPTSTVNRENPKSFGALIRNSERKSNAREETIDTSHRPNLDKVEQESNSEQKTGPLFDSTNFRQFSDEDLEKYVKFVKPDKVVDDTSKVEYLRAALQELHSMVQDLRRAEKDPLVADLLLRTVNAKIDYYALSKNVDDYNKVIRVLKEAQKEIEECSTQTSTNIAEQILKDLRLQGIILKKA